MKHRSRFGAATLLMMTACSAGQNDGTVIKAASSEASASSSVADQPEEIKPEASPSRANETVPARFQGLYAPDQRACEGDYYYQPTFQNVTVNARDVSFFETGGPVTDINVDGNNIAITLRETVGDGEFTRAIFFALNDDGTARYRAEQNSEVKTFVRCAVR